MENKYPSFVNGPIPEPDYDCRELKASDYTLKARCNKTNPDCQAMIEEEKQKNYNVKVIDLDQSKHGNNMVDIWIKQKSSFKKMFNYEPKGFL